MTGFGSIKSKKNYKPEKHKESYTYTVRYQNAIKIIEMVEPYLIINQKKKRAQMIIDHYKALTVRNGRYTKEQLKAKEQFYEEFMAI